MADQLKQIISAQFEASLCMLKNAIERCPDEHWEGLIAKYPFWLVAYHALYMTDFRLWPSEAAFRPRERFHPRGMSELEEEYPSRMFSKSELLDYAQVCRQFLHEVMPSEVLDAPSGFSFLPFTRAELHLHSIRHIHHHTGQLGAFLRRAGVDPGGWVRAGWK